MYGYCFKTGIYILINSWCTSVAEGAADHRECGIAACARSDR